MITLLIDGRSGSGKTELAAAIAGGWAEAQLVHLDDIYPGWHGLEAASALVPQIISGLRWRRWDWATGSHREWHDLDPARPLIVEGCGALTRAARARATFGIWVECPDELRKARAISREPSFEPHWQEWTAQEETFIAAERPRELADAIVDGTDVTNDIARWRAMLDPARVEE